MTTDDETMTDDGDRTPEAPPATAGMRKVLARIRRDLQEVAGLEVESTAGLRRDDGGWSARVEVVEVSRVPPSTDILATYEVAADGDGAVQSFDRVERYRRSEAGA